MLSDDLRYRILRKLNSNPDVSQRALAEELGISLGKLNYCLNALIQRGWVKVRNFKSSNKKSAYAYLLTPRGIEEKARVTLRFLRARIEEYDSLAKEIKQLRGEAQVAREHLEAMTIDAQRIPGPGLRQPTS